MTEPVAQRGSGPAATLSLDLDNLWCYQRSFGIEAWRDYPSFLDLAVPRILEVLDRLDLRLTVFIIGRDAAQPANRALMAEWTKRGHEPGNHSYDHELSLHRWPRERIADEVRRAGDVIAEATGKTPRGFRGPAFGLSPALLEALTDLGYAYDASSFPSSLGALARLYHRRQAAKAGGRAEIQDDLYGNLRDSRQPLRPYRWSLGNGSLVETPVTTLPLLRLPFQGTYLNYLADRSPGLASGYFNAALSLCRLRRVPPSFLLHATDFLGSDDSAALACLPGMRRSGAEKTAFMTERLGALKRRFDVLPIGAFVDRLEAHHDLPQLSPALSA
ncbi:polysaccharide deacetylase family protein [Pelagibius sp.]|uniref:polysaccharide deacetylase family protein n=1 Tax=Pelagibius sp. TaxID=1931238 RepID=UPI0026150931|nr:polysaccharide deacetylase family protein [Pelagibius sp.]